MIYDDGDKNRWDFLRRIFPQNSIGRLIKRKNNSVTLTRLVFVCLCIDSIVTSAVVVAPLRPETNEIKKLDRFALMIFVVPEKYIRRRYKWLALYYIVRGKRRNFWAEFHCIKSFSFCFCFFLFVCFYALYFMICKRLFESAYYNDVFNRFFKRPFRRS